MYKLVKIKCKTCSTVFLPKSEKNVFCQRRCFKKNFYHRKKAEELNNIKFPIFKCPSCARHIELSFDPVKDEKSWLGFSCPFCKTLLINVWEDIITQESSKV